MVGRARRILLHDDVVAFSGPSSGYRNRVDLVFFKDGLGMRDSFDSFVDVTRSELATDRINSIIAQVRERFVGFDPFIQKAKRGTLRYAVIRALETSSISFVLNARGDVDRAREAIASFAAESDVENVLITFTEPSSDVSVSSEYEIIKGSDVLEASLVGVALRVHVQGFFQNNLVMAQKMHGFIKDSLPGSSGTLIDLYGGVGSFACTLGDSFERAIVIEEHEGAASLAAQNLERNGVRGEAVCADASVLVRYGSDQVTVITDPPRIGMSEIAVRALARLRPERIVYVSCNPLIAPRDLAYLKGYRIEKAAVFDMFPGTDHFEMVVVLSRVEE